MTTNIIPSCPVCGMENTYPDGNNFICPDCSHEWSQIAKQDELQEQRVHKDAHGTILNDGDTVTLIKDLKVKGSSLVIKGGTKIKKVKESYLVDAMTVTEAEARVVKEFESAGVSLEYEVSAARESKILQVIQ